VPVRKGLLTTVQLLPSAAVVEHTGARRCETGLPDNYGVRIVADGESGQFKVHTVYPHAIVFFAGAKAVKSEWGRIRSEAVTLEGMHGTRLRIDDPGEYVVKLSL